MAQKITFNKIITAGFDKDIRTRYAEKIASGNGRTARFLSAAGVVVSLIMVIKQSTMPLDTWGAMPFYLLQMVLLLFCTFVPEKKKFGEKGTRWMYVTVSIILVSTALHGLLVSPVQDCMPFCLALAVLPSMILDAGWCTILPGLIVCALFAPVAITSNMWPEAMHCLYDFIPSFVVGALLADFHLHNRAKELALRDNITGERDTDALTKVMRRGPAEERIRQILESAALPCVMMMLDVDNFKGVNDTYGHTYGDRVLEELSALLRRSFRSSDVVCRIGGDEFMVFVVGAPEGDWLKSKTDMIIQYLATTPIPGSKKLYVSISMGAVRSPKYGTDFEKLFVKADHALYEAKRHGKNRCCIFGEEYDDTPDKGASVAEKATQETATEATKEAPKTEQPAEETAAV